MFVRAYGDIPVMYTPSAGEVVFIRRACTHPYAQAVILGHSRRLHRVIRYEFVWAETVPGYPVVAGEFSHVYVRPDGPPFLRLSNEGRPRRISELPTPP